MAIRRKSRSHPFLIAVLSILCLALITFGILFFTRNNPSVATIKPVFQVEGLDPAAKTGALPGSPKDEKSPGEDLFSYRINAEPQFDQDGKGKIMLENPHFNEYLMVLEIAVEGKLIYQSQYIAPNQYIEQITLQEPLEAGTYTAAAYINAIDPETLTLAGTLTDSLNITIK